MTPITMVGSFLCSATLCGALLPPLIGVLTRRQVLDAPVSRSSHVTPTPRGGGLALVVGVAVVATFAGVPAALLATVAGFAVLGGADDLCGLPARTRLGLQALLAAGASSWLLLSGSAAWPLALLVAVLLLVYVNAFNFMDGINGISGLQAIVVAGACMAVGWLTEAPVLAAAAAAVAGAGAAFLPLNLPNARVFLGDVGSYGLGAALALLLAFASTRLPVWAVILVPSVYLADVFWTLMRRARAGRRLTEAHCEHVYQRLLAGVGSHARVALFVTACSATVAACAITAGMTGSAVLRTGSLLLAGAVLAGYLAAPRLQALGAGSAAAPGAIPAAGMRRA